MYEIPSVFFCYHMHHTIAPLFYGIGEGMRAFHDCSQDFLGLQCFDDPFPERSGKEFHLSNFIDDYGIPREIHAGNAYPFDVGKIDPVLRDTEGALDITMSEYPSGSMERLDGKSSPSPSLSDFSRIKSCSSMTPLNKSVDEGCFSNAGPSCDQNIHGTRNECTMYSLNTSPEEGFKES